MRIFKATFNDRKGRTRETSKWYVEFPDQRGKPKKFAGYASKAATEELGRNLLRLASYHAATHGQIDPGLRQWVTDLSPSVRRRLVKHGLLSAERDAVAKPLAEHLDDFEAALKAKGGTHKHAKLVTSRARRVIEGCDFKHLGDVRGAKVLTFLETLRKDEKNDKEQVTKRGIGAQTHNFHIAALKQFFGWMIRERRAHENPVAHLGGLNVRADRRHDRRALTVEEGRKLLKTAETGPDRFGVPGPTRALFYRLAIESGLRRRELCSLTRASFDLGKTPTVTVTAAYAKNGRSDTLPLRDHFRTAVGST